MRNLSLNTLAITFVAFSFPLWPIRAQAPESGLSHNVTGTNQAQSKSITLNQIDTSKYPNVNLFVTVLDGGAPVTGLASEDFIVREDEVLQSPITVAPTLDPISLTLTLDTSGSMKEAISVVQASASEFIDNLGAADSATVISFARGVTKLSDFSNDKATLKSAISGTKARGDTALYDGLFSSVESLQARSGRKAVILLSDGVDDDGTGKQLSTHSVEDVLKLAKEINVPIFTIGLGSGIDERVLVKVAEATGGTFNKAPDTGKLKELYAAISKQLSGQYSLSYASNLPGDATTHRVQISHGEIKGVKEFVAPLIAAPIIAVPAQPAPTQAVATVAATPVVEKKKPMLIKGGNSMDSATIIEPNVEYLTDSQDAFQWYKVIAKPGQYITFWTQNVEGTYGGVRLHNAKREQMESTNLVSWGIASFTGLARYDYTGDMYFSCNKKGYAFVAFLRDGSDSLGAGSDVGNDEASAKNLELNLPASGYLQKDWDNRDTYTANLQPGNYMLKLRPSENLNVTIEMKDLEEGRNMGSCSTANKGALIKCEIQLKSVGRVLFDISGNTFGRYNMILGAPDVQSPMQLPNPEIPERTSLRN